MVKVPLKKYNLSPTAKYRASMMGDDLGCCEWPNSGVDGVGSASGSGEREEWVVLFDHRDEPLITEGRRPIGFRGKGGC